MCIQSVSGEENSSLMQRCKHHSVIEGTYLHNERKCNTDMENKIEIICSNKPRMRYASNVRVQYIFTRDNLVFSQLHLTKHYRVYHCICLLNNNTNKMIITYLKLSEH